MPPKIALIGYIVFVTWLLRLESKRFPQASYALWIPTFWLLICGSRPIARWFSSVSISCGEATVGSPLDQLVLGSLILLALLTVLKRKIALSLFSKNNFWLIILYLYLGFSILWSEHPSVSVRRWIRMLGIFPMTLLLISERSPLKGLESIFRRCAYMLIPLSIILIKYFPYLGRQYNRWNGELMWTGVALQKNSLGQLCTLSIIFIAWSFLRDWRIGAFSKTNYHNFADGLILALAVFLLLGPGNSYSATSIGCMIIGLFSLLLLFCMENRSQYIASFLVCAAAFMAFVMPFSNIFAPIITSIFDRDMTFTGRTLIWSLGLDIAARNPIFGTGFGGFWGFAENQITSTYNVNHAHNGFLDVYIEIGIAGLAVLLAFLLNFFKTMRRLLFHTFEWPAFSICFLIISLIFNYTESNFLKSSSFLWNSTIFLSVALSDKSLSKVSSDSHN